MALYKVLCAVAVTIFLAPNGCLSEELEMDSMSKCGLGSPYMQPEDMPWRVEIVSTEEQCAGTLISDTKVLTSCSCNRSLAEVEIIGQDGYSSEAEDFEVVGDYEESGANYPFVGGMDVISCVYTLSKPSNMTPICLGGADSGISYGTPVFVGECEGEITKSSECNMTSNYEDQLCAVYTGNDTCEVNEGAGAVYYAKRWTLAGITRQAVLNENDSTIPIFEVSFSDNDNMTVDFNDTTPAPMLRTTDFPDFPDFTEFPPKPPTKCPKPHPPQTTKPPCGCKDGERDDKDDSVFGSGVMMHTSPFILLCSCYISLQYLLLTN